MTKGNLYVISGPSGVGKSTAVKAVMEKHPTLRFSVSVTTREIRQGEVDGESYYFISQGEFDALLEQGKLLEHAQYVGNCYGTPETPIDEMLSQGIDVLMDIEPCGALQVQTHRKDAILIFMAAPSFGELSRRLHGRGDTSADKIKERLARAKWEYEQAKYYDYIVINDDVIHASGEIEAIMMAEKCRTNDRLRFLKEEE